MISTAFRTDLLFPRFDGIVREAGDYCVIVTPSNPGFYWGNFLLLPRPPTRGDLERWQALFDKEFSEYPNVQHRSFGIDTTDGEPGEVEEFLSAGFELVNDAVLELTELVEPEQRQDVVMRRFDVESDWNAWHRLNVDSDPADGKGDAYAAFKTILRHRYQAMVAAELGTWWGAFDGERLVASLGLFPEPGAGVARFQAVETDPEYRGCGIASALVAAACRDALGGVASRLIIVASVGSSAERIYRRLGFVEIERQLGLFRPS